MIETVLSTPLNEKLQHRCSSVSFSKFLGAPILWNICEQLLLKTEAADALLLIFKIFMKTYFVEHLRATASEN